MKTAHPFKGHGIFSMPKTQSFMRHSSGYLMGFHFWKKTRTNNESVWGLRKWPADFERILKSDRKQLIVRLDINFDF